MWFDGLLSKLSQVPTLDARSTAMVLYSGCLRGTLEAQPEVLGNFVGNWAYQPAVLDVPLSKLAL